MKPMFPGTCMAILFLTATPTALHAQATASGVDSKPAVARGEIEKVIEQFRTSIIDKDKAKFLGLFPAAGPVAWRSVIADANLRQLRKQKPEAGKADYNAKYSHLSFIDGIVASANRSEETFDNIRIDTDGEVAAVTFDYRFLSNGKETNHGQESWNVVRTDAGWKIVSVVWSIRWDITTQG